MRSGRHPAVLGLLLSLAPGCSSQSSASACGYPAARHAALPTMPRFHEAEGGDPQWRTRLTSELAPLRADSSVRALFEFDSAVTAPDRSLVRSYGATITDEPGFLVGIVATVRVDSLRRFAATDPATTARVTDVDLVEVTVLPECG